MLALLTIGTRGSGGMPYPDIRGVISIPACSISPRFRPNVTYVTYSSANVPSRWSSSHRAARVFVRRSLFYFISAFTFDVAAATDDS